MRFEMRVCGGSWGLVVVLIVVEEAVGEDVEVHVEQEEVAADGMTGRVERDEVGVGKERREV